MFYKNAKMIAVLHKDPALCNIRMTNIAELGTRAVDRNMMIRL